MQLIAKSNSMSSAELSQKKSELKLQHKVIFRVTVQAFPFGQVY